MPDVLRIGGFELAQFVSFDFRSGALVSVGAREDLLEVVEAAPILVFVIAS